MPNIDISNLWFADLRCDTEKRQSGLKPGIGVAIFFAQDLTPAIADTYVFDARNTHRAVM
jgi:hypothetical protein